MTDTPGIKSRFTGPVTLTTEPQLCCAFNLNDELTVLLQHFDVYTQQPVGTAVRTFSVESLIQSA